MKYKKRIKRLEARIKSYESIPLEKRQGFKKPGSYKK